MQTAKCKCGERQAWADASAARKSAAKKQRQRLARMVNKAFKEESK